MSSKVSCYQLLSVHPHFSSRPTTLVEWEKIMVYTAILRIISIVIRSLTLDSQGRTRLVWRTHFTRSSVNSEKKYLNRIEKEKPDNLKLHFEPDAGTLGNLYQQTTNDLSSHNAYHTNFYSTSLGDMFNVYSKLNLCTTKNKNKDILKKHL